MDDVTVRRYRPEDAAETRQVFEQAIRETAALHYTPDQIAAWAPQGEVDLEAWSARRESAWTVVAEHSDVVVGFCDLTDGGLLDMLFVHPDVGGRGIARSLVDAVLVQARATGMTRVVTHASRAARPPLRALWIRCRS